MGLSGTLLAASAIGLAWCGEQFRKQAWASTQAIVVLAGARRLQDGTADIWLTVENKSDQTIIVNALEVVTPAQAEFATHHYTGEGEAYLVQQGRRLSIGERLLMAGRSSRWLELTGIGPGQRAKLRAILSEWRTGRRIRRDLVIRVPR